MKREVQEAVMLWEFTHFYFYIEGVSLWGFDILGSHFREYTLQILDMTHQGCLDVNSSGKMNISTPIDQVLDGYIVQALSKINAC